MGKSRQFTKTAQSSNREPVTRLLAGGHHEAIERGVDCVIVPCDQETAVLLSRLFIRELAMPTCCHYDGHTLSMYCGAAGRDKEHVKAIVSGIVPGRAKSKPRAA